MIDATARAVLSALCIGFLLPGTTIRFRRGRHYRRFTLLSVAITAEHDKHAKLANDEEGEAATSSTAPSKVAAA